MDMTGPMFTGFDYSQPTNWSPGKAAPEGYRVVNMMGDQFLERIYPSKEEIGGLPMGPMGMPGMMPPMMNDPDEGLSGQEYAEKYNIPYATGGRVGYGHGTGKFGIIDALQGETPENDQEYSLPYKAIEMLTTPFRLYAEGINSVLEQSKNPKKYYGIEDKAQGGRIGKFGGGMGVTMPSVPTGMPRVNTGGIRELDYRQSGGFVPVGVKEKADDVPAMLSKNEFVMTADAVKAAGGGSVEKGAQRMYDTMKRLEGKIA